MKLLTNPIKPRNVINPKFPNKFKPFLMLPGFFVNRHHSRDAIPMESLELGENIGEGEFGSVHKAVYMTEDGEEQSVAVKVCFQ